MKRGKGQNQMLWPLMESELMSDRVFQRLYIEGSYFRLRPEDIGAIVALDSHSTPLFAEPIK